MPETETPPETTEQTPAMPDPPPDADGRSDDLSADELASLPDRSRRYVERMKGENAQRRHAQRETERQLKQRDKEIEQRDKEIEALRRKYETDQQRADREAIEAREREVREAREDERAIVLSEVAERVLTNDMVAIAAELGFQNPSDAVRLIDKVPLLAEADDQKRAAQARKMLEELREQNRLPTRTRGVLISQGARSQAPDGPPRQRDWVRHGV